MKKLKVSDETYNTYNLRVVTSGGDFERFRANPVMLWNHSRKELPIGTWSELSIEGTEVFATPDFDMVDEFAAKIAGKYERNVIRAASIGIRVLKMEMDEGNTTATVTKWELMEISMTDIPSNRNAVAFYDASENKIELSAVIAEFSTTKSKPNFNMDKFFFVPSLLGLSAEATPEAVQVRINELLALRAENDRMKAEMVKQMASQVEAMVQLAIDDEKIPATQKDHFIKLATADMESVRSILDAMKPAPKVKLSSIPGGSRDAVTLDGKTFKQLQAENPDALVRLKAENFAQFNELYKASYGKDYKQ